MKINNEMRKVIWDKFCELEFKIRDMKGIVQNEMDITEDDIETFRIENDKAICKLDELYDMVVDGCK